MLMCSSRRSFDSSGNPRQRTSLACHVILANKRLSSRQKDCRQWKSALDLLNALVHSLPVLWFAAWFWCVQCSGSHGQQRFFRKTEVWHRWWKPTVLPVQLEMSRHDTWTGLLYSHFFVWPLLAKNRIVKLLKIHCTKIGTGEQFTCACLHPLNGNSVGEVKVRVFYLSTRTFRWRKLKLLQRAIFYSLR